MAANTHFTYYKGTPPYFHNNAAQITRSWGNTTLLQRLVHLKTNRNPNQHYPDCEHRYHDVPTFWLGGVICINMGMSCVENVYMGAYGDQESDPLQLEVWAVVSCLMRVLWTELGWYRRPASPAAISPALGSTFWLLSYGPADLLIGTCNSYKLGSKYSSQTAKAQTKTLWRDASRSEHNKYGSGRPCPSTLPSSLLKIVRLHSQS